MELTGLFTDQDKESKGVWVDFGNEAKVLIARWDNPEQQNLLFQKMLPLRDKLSKAQSDLNDGDTELPENYPTEDLLRIQLEVTAATVFLGMRGFEWNGEPIEDTYENRLWVLKELREFRMRIMSLAQDRSRYVRDATEVTVGNSPSSSSGKKSTVRKSNGSRGSKKKASTSRLSHSDLP